MWRESRFVISSFIFQTDPYKFEGLKELKMCRLGQIPKVCCCVFCVYVSAIITTVCIAWLPHLKWITQTHCLPGSALKTSIITNGTTYVHRGKSYLLIVYLYFSNWLSLCTFPVALATLMPLCTYYVFLCLISKCAFHGSTSYDLVK